MTGSHIHRTAVFTIHNPTRHVRAVLDHALDHYTTAYTVILHYFSQYTVDELHAMATSRLGPNGEQITNTKHLAQILFARKVPQIEAVLAPLESSLRESLKLHVAANLMSYIELSLMPDQTPSYPERLRKADREPARVEALEGLCTVADNQEEEDVLGAQLQRSKQAEVVPLTFYRIDTDRNCGLFYNQQTQTFYARLYVVSPHSHHAKPITIAGRYTDVRSGSIYMRKEDADKTEGVESFGAGKGSILVPLEMGRWHEEVLRFTNVAFFPQRRGDETHAAIPKSAHLVKSGENYQLHVAFELPKPERIKPGTLLGVDRGITCLAAGAVVSLDGREVIETFQTDGTQLRDLRNQIEHLIRVKQAHGKPTKGERRRARLAEQHVHLCANQIVELAQKYQAQVVMEDLSGFASGKMLSKRNFQKVQEVVNAKLALVGLPPIREVGAAYTSQTCSQCGHVSKENRNEEDRTQFRCMQCGYEAHADVQAGISIARKLLWMQQRSKEKQREVPEERRTPWTVFVKQFSPVVLL